jgi:hypothetical protein
VTKPIKQAPILPATQAISASTQALTLAESLMQTQLESQWKHGWNSMEPRLDF